MTETQTAIVIIKNIVISISLSTDKKLTAIIKKEHIIKNKKITCKKVVQIAAGAFEKLYKKLFFALLFCSFTTLTAPHIIATML